jgi:hypothetical protein
MSKTEQAGIGPSSVSQLKVKWAFGFPATLGHFDVLEVCTMSVLKNGA